MRCPAWLGLPSCKFAYELYFLFNGHGLCPSAWGGLWSCSVGSGYRYDEYWGHGTAGGLASIIKGIRGPVVFGYRLSSHVMDVAI